MYTDKEFAEIAKDRFLEAFDKSNAGKAIGKTNDEIVAHIKSIRKALESA